MQSVIFAKNGSWPVATSASRSTRRAPPSIQGGTERPECRCAPPTAGQIEAHSAPPSRSCSGAGVGRQGGRRGAYLVREQVRDATRRRCACARRYVVNAERVRRGGEGDVAPGVWGGRAVRISRRASTTRQGMSLSGALRRERDGAGHSPHPPTPPPRGLFWLFDVASATNGAPLPGGEAAAPRLPSQRRLAVDALSSRRACP